MTKIAIGLGSNKGNRLKNLREARQLLKQNGAEILASSDVYETAPVGVTDQARFLNACILIGLDIEPAELLPFVKDIEKKMGRKKTRRWGPREIDIDILLMEETVFQDERLSIPHPEMHKRSFVLVPLAQIASEWKHPLLDISVGTLMKELPDRDISMLRITKL